MFETLVLRRLPRLKTAAFLLSLFVLTSPPSVRGQAATPTDVPPASRGDILFAADVTTVRGDDGRPVARLYLELPYQSLRFVQNGSAWSAACEITVIVHEKHDEQLTGDSWSVPLHSAVDPNTRDVEAEIYRRRFDLPVVPGRLRFEIRVGQDDSGKNGDWTTTLDVPDYTGHHVAISDFGFGVPPSDSLPRVPDWGDSAFFPWPRRRYGDDHPIQCVSGVIYDSVTSPDTTYHLLCQIQNAQGHTVGNWTEEVRRAGGRGAFLLRPTIANLTLGPYRLRLETQVGGEKARRERWFEIDETRVNLFEDTRMIRIVLGYVARGDELLKLEDLPADSLQSFWNDFWKKRDPTPGTAKNERLSEFLRRLEYVNSHFSVIDAGWASDMGRIYIRYGAPDEVDRTPYSNSGPPREVWYYIQRGLRFVFLDTEGFGRFRLTGSTRQ